MKNLAYNLSLVFVLCLLGLVIYSFFLLFYPVKTIDFKQEPLIVLTKEVANGDNLEYVSEYCKYINKPATINRFFIDGLVFSLDTIVTDMPMGCNKKTVSIQVPETLPEGEYSLKVIATYQVNPLRKITKTWQTENFNVIKKENK